MSPGEHADTLARDVGACSLVRTRECGRPSLAIASESADALDVAPLAIVPVTLQGLRAGCGEPTMALEACAVCKHIPRQCSRFEKGGEVQTDDIPSEVKQLVPFIGELSGWRGEVLRCATCSRLYWYEHEYELIYGGSEDTYDYRRLDVEALFRSEWFVRRRVADEQLVGRALAVAYPQLPVSDRRLGSLANQTFFRRHGIAQVELGKETIWIALPDEGSMIDLTANLDGLARIAADDPPGDLEQRERAVEYAGFADRVTSPYRHGSLSVAAFDDIPWRGDLTDAELAYIADLRGASRVAPEQVECVDGHVVVRRWVVAHQKLICRILTVLPTGEVRREDAIVGEDLPTHLGKRWNWNHKRERMEPVG